MHRQHRHCLHQQHTGEHHCLRLEFRALQDRCRLLWKPRSPSENQAHLRRQISTSDFIDKRTSMQQALTNQRGFRPRDAAPGRRQIRHAHARLRCCDKCSETQVERQKLAAADEAASSAGVRVAVSLLKGYKRLISPILPNVCRFVPTCSSYSVEAYEKHGVGRGSMLTAWRLLRCNPLNPKWGYDPVRWPPVGLEWAWRQPPHRDPR